MAQTTTTRIRPGGGSPPLPAKSAITEGQLVEAVVDSGVDKYQPASAGSTTVAGVARTNAGPTDTSTGSALNVNPQPTSLAPEWGEFYVTYAANCNVGKALKAAASGQVTPWVSGTDAADLIIGHCTKTTTSGNIGPALIRR